MQDIRKWFNGKKDYTEGVSLYKKHSADQSLTRLFEQGHSPFRMEKLISALDDILSQNKKPTSINEESPIVKMVVKNITRDMDARVHNEPPIEKRWSVTPDEIEASLKEQWRPLFSEMMNLMARIDDVAREGLKDPNKEQEAGRMALRILKLDDMCDAIYKQREYYLENKRLPVAEKPIEISLDPNQWPTKLENHKKYVRRFRAQLKADPGNTEKAALLKKHEWAVSEYKRLLNIPDAV